jgi:hypothetical protein
MTSDTPAAAMEIAQTVFEAKRGRKFDRAVREFVHVLRTVPDCPPVEISGGTIQVLRHLAERVIEQIEQHSTSGQDRKAVQQDLAQAAYDIRHALEEIDRWQRHYAGR